MVYSGARSCKITEDAGPTSTGHVTTHHSQLKSHGKHPSKDDESSITQLLIHRDSGLGTLKVGV